MKPEEGSHIFDLIEKFAGYGFNKSHSSRYAFVAFQTAHLKCYWPCEFMASLLTYDKGDQAKAKPYFQECKDMGIDILPPDINQSVIDFTVVYDSEELREQRKGKIRFGLGAVKGIGVKALEKIIEARNECGGFTNLFHFCDTVDLRAVNKTVIESLIKAGAFDRYGGSRSQLFAAVENAIRAGQRAQADKLSGQGNLFAAFGQEEEETDIEQSLPDVPAWPEMTMLNYEKDVLGMYVTSNPLSRHADTITAYSTAHTDEIDKLGDGTEIVLGGMISSTRIINIKSGRNIGKKMAVLNIEDFNGHCEVVLFANSYAENANFIETDKVVFIQGKVDKSKETVQVLCNKIYEPETVIDALSTNVCIKWNAEYTEDKIEMLKDVISEHQGKSPVYVDIRTASGSVISAQFDRKYSVLPDQHFRTAITEIVGDAGLELRRSK